MAEVWCPVGEVTFHYVAHGDGLPVLVLHGAGVDHREAEACFEPAFRARPGFRRIYPDLPGMGRSTAPPSLDSADGVVDALLGLVDLVAEGGPFVVAGHSAGAHFARGIGARRPEQVAGLALVCPLLPGARDVPPHRPVVDGGDLGDAEFRGYFVVQTPAMLDRYTRFVVPAAALVDEAAMARIGERWEFGNADRPFDGPTLIVAGRHDSTVGYAAAMDLFEVSAHATLAVIDGAGHALPHERPDIFAALLSEWLIAVQVES